MGLDGFWAFGSLALPPCLPPLLPPDAQHHPGCVLVTLAQVASHHCCSGVSAGSCCFLRHTTILKASSWLSDTPRSRSPYTPTTCGNRARGAGFGGEHRTHSLSGSMLHPSHTPVTPSKEQKANTPPDTPASNCKATVRSIDACKATPSFAGP
jgi:hypothetical protein